MMSRDNLNDETRVIPDANASACRSNIIRTCSSKSESGTPIGAVGNSRGSPLELPTAPIGVPDSDFEEHVRIMFDLQALAFASGITRVSSFKLSRDIIK